MPCRRLGFVTDSLSMLGSIGIERLIPSPLQGAYNGGTNLRRTEEIGAGGRVTKTERDSEICGARSVTVGPLLLLMMLLLLIIP